MLLLYILFLEIKKTSFIIISSNKPVYFFFVLFLNVLFLYLFLVSKCIYSYAGDIFLYPYFILYCYLTYFL